MSASSTISEFDEQAVADSGLIYWSVLHSKSKAWWKRGANRAAATVFVLTFGGTVFGWEAEAAAIALAAVLLGSFIHAWVRTARLLETGNLYDWMIAPISASAVFGDLVQYVWGAPLPALIVWSIAMPIVMGFANAGNSAVSVTSLFLFPVNHLLCGLAAGAGTRMVVGGNALRYVMSRLLETSVYAAIAGCGIAGALAAIARPVSNNSAITAPEAILILTMILSVFSGCLFATLVAIRRFNKLRKRQWRAHVERATARVVERA